MSRTVCSEGACTACGVCSAVCPVGCVSFSEDGNGYVRSVIDELACCGCEECDAVCPVDSTISLSSPSEAYAAWAGDPAVRRRGASGGVASALCAHVTSRGWWFSGVGLDERFHAQMSLSRDLTDLLGYGNSKYTFSSMDGVYEQAENVITAGGRILFIGLPCQVAAMRKYTETKNLSDGLVTVDLVCHGVPPAVYLPQHVASVDPDGVADTLQFRDPAFGTQNHVLTLRKGGPKGEVVYREDVRIDLYQVGYHGGHIYRESCYSCPFARHERAGDLTLGDYHCLGLDAPFSGPCVDVSVVLVNSKRGEALLEEAVTAGAIVASLRPVNEPLLHDPRLNSPSPKTPERTLFINAYAEKETYDAAAAAAFSKFVWRGRLQRLLRVREAKAWLRRTLPRPIVDGLRRLRSTTIENRD